MPCAARRSNWSRDTSPPVLRLLTSGCSATRCAATPRCSPATRRWKPHGAWWTRCSTWPRRCNLTRPAPGAPIPRPSWRPGNGGMIRGRKTARPADKHGADTGTGNAMNANLQRLRELGQSLWLDNITRKLLDDGTLERWIDEYGLTGLTSNPTIFDEAIGG